MDGFAVILKVPGPTSHDVVARVRRVTSSKVGHLGTLDPLAAGVLPLALGRATRFGRYLMGSPKTYRVQVLFGLSTATGDLEGERRAGADASLLDGPAVAGALSAFSGRMAQTPPLASAVKVGGIRLYEHHRRGEGVEVAPREVTFHSCRLLSFRPGPLAEALIEVEVSAGTYVRRFAEDLGAALGLPAVVGMLLRAKAGPFGLEKAQLLDELDGPGALRLSDVGTVLCTSLPPLRLDGASSGRFAHGAAVEAGSLAGGTHCAVFSTSGEFLGVGEVSADGTALLPRTVFGEASA